MLEAFDELIFDQSVKMVKLKNIKDASSFVLPIEMDIRQKIANMI
jgi:hypothetical protein